VHAVRVGRVSRHLILLPAVAPFPTRAAANTACRSPHRLRRTEAHATHARHKALGLPEDVPLAPQSEDDARHAALVTFGDDRAFDKARRLSRDAIRSSSIFSAPPDKVSGGASGSGGNVRGGGGTRWAASAASAAPGRLGKTAGGAVAKLVGRGGAGSQKQASAAARRKRLLGHNVKLSLSNPK